jgi:hypothetical protein
LGNDDDDVMEIEEEVCDIIRINIGLDDLDVCSFCGYRREIGKIVCRGA